LILPGLLVHTSLMFNRRRRGWHDRAAKTLVVTADDTHATSQPEAADVDS